MTSLKIYPDSDSLSQAAAQHITGILDQAILQRRIASLVLSGGSTPQAAYACMAQRDLLPGLDLDRLHIFWGDERCVQPDHADSNYRMAHEVLLAGLPIPQQNIHRIRGELAPGQAAKDYERRLQDYFTSNRLSASGSQIEPIFDLILLGLGEDGHTASLFPATAALEERERWVVSLDHDQPPLPLVARVTLALPVINAARNILFMVRGDGKAKIVKQIISTGEQKPTLPAARVRPHTGDLTWMLDKGAASLLK